MLNVIISFAIILVILVLPFVKGESKFTTKASTVSYFMAKLDDSVSPLGSIAMTWVLHTQPHIQPIGRVLEDKLSVISAFNATIADELDSLDKAVMAKLHSPSKTGSNFDAQQSLKEQKQAIKKTGVLAKYPLTIETNAQDASIKNMSIKPKYQPGMELPVGNYKIVVSAPGYETKTEWISHTKAKQTHIIALTKK